MLAATPNPFLKYHLFAPNGHDDRYVTQSPFANSAATTSSVSPFMLPRPVTAGGTPQPRNAIQRRNHERLNSLVTRLQNFNGSVTELLAVARVQQELDVTFTDLDRAKNQLKDVLQQFELRGHMNDRQCKKKNGATRDLTKASHRIAQLTNKLWDLQHQKSSSC
ncbi:hypothetical protein F5X98DRAFT_376607 [Xylaria grammica]|nr:hypothetical protein F5X98DRAFT_376607 [Xylaria grammica]